LIKASSGKVVSKDVDVKENTDWKYYTGSHLDDGFLIDYLTPEEYFEFLMGVHKLSKGDLDEFYTNFQEFFNEEILGKRKYIRDFSSGNKQKIGIAAALMAKPEVVILDEPFNSLDPTTQIRLKNLLNKLKEEQQVTLLISSHDLDHVTEVCERIVILEKGKIVEDKPTNENTLNELKEYFAV
jgi:ABC-2 type transport system ATP-binding protein